MKRLTLLAACRCLAITAAVTLVGCGRGPQGPRVFPVAGKVLVDGKPAHRAQVTFRAVGPPNETDGMTIRPFAEVDPDGSFRATTVLPHDGAPPGEYKVTIVWPEFKSVQGEENQGPDRLGDAYNNLAQPKFSVTIKEGPNELPPFELKAP